MSTVYVPNFKDITLKGVSVRVTDPSLKSVLSLLKDAKPILIKLMNFSQEGGSEDPLDNIIQLLAEPDTFKGFCLCASACTTTKSPAFFEDIGISDTVLLVETLIEVVNWESLKDLFTKMAPAMTGTTNQANKAS